MLKFNAIHKIINTISRATNIQFRSIKKNLRIRKRHFLFVLVCYCWYQPSKISNKVFTTGYFHQCLLAWLTTVLPPTVACGCFAVSG